MGRRYTGDIEGKFWFGVQLSDDASFFGGEQSEPSLISFYFSEEDMPDIIKGIKQCEEALGTNKDILNAYFKKNDGYTNDELAAALGIEKAGLRPVLEWYARLELGLKIKKCVEGTGECSFDAEL